MSKRTALLVGVSALLATACEQHTSPTGGDRQQPLLDLQSGQPSVSNAPGFLFLPPIAGPPKQLGTFDPSFLPFLVLEACEWQNDGCVGPLTATFTHATDPASGRLVVIGGDADDDVGFYGVLWHTSTTPLFAGNQYRVRVLIGEVELGYADLQVVRSYPEIQSVDQTAFVPVVSGQALPIKFRIEEGLAGAAVIGPDGGDVAGDGADLTIPQDALPEDTPVWIIPVPIGDLPPNRVLDDGAGGVIAFSGVQDLIPGTVYKCLPFGLPLDSPVQLTINYGPLPPGISPSDLTILASDDGMTWFMTHGSVVDPVAQTVTVSIQRFRFFAIDPWKETPPDAQDDAYTVDVGATLNAPISGGLLSNDVLGFPLPSLASFGGGDLGGAVTDHAPGSTVPLAGGTLTINTFGDFDLVAPTTPGVFGFEYRLANVAGADDATVTITVVSPSGYDCTAQNQIPTSECEALVAFYAATNGDDWTDNSGWLATLDPCNWFGVGCNPGTVAELNMLRGNRIGNGLTGNVPAELASLTNLTELNLSFNQLSGGIPPELSSLSSLVFLALSNNQLTGPVPPELGNLAELVSLTLDFNALTGVIPATLDNLSNLQSLHLHFNMLTGGIPPELGNLPQLSNLQLQANPLGGEIPRELANLSNLRVVRLQSNDLTGPIPPELGNLANLQWLLLDGNALTGVIPAELGSLANLALLQLHRNALTGNIPQELGNLSNLVVLELADNALTGAIPPQLGNLTSLRRLGLHLNSLTGPIPGELASLTNLNFLLLSSNQLSGQVPLGVARIGVIIQELPPPFPICTMVGNSLFIPATPEYLNLTNPPGQAICGLVPGG